jgi:hypothetical protein
MESACESMVQLWNVIMMEEYEAKQQYLRHLKRMGEIREGGSKLPLCNATNHPLSSLARTSNSYFMQNQKIFLPLLAARSWQREDGTTRALSE